MEGVLAAQCGFEPYERDDGLWPDQTDPSGLAYNRYLRSLGYNVDNPWHDYANAAAGPDGEVLSGWLMRHAREPARIAEEHSETAYMTNRAMDFIDEAGDTPWCLHLSYIKPHWPYIAPAPYHALYGPEHLIPANRHEDERHDPHPVYAAFLNHEESDNFARDEVRETVIPAYMGLIKQIDDHLARLWLFLEERGLFENTMIVVTSDHGDYLGDHWLGEKELFHEESVRIPLVLYDPDQAANATRGTADFRFVEAIDLAPTFVAAAGGEPPAHILEGRSLTSLTRGTAQEWRNYAISECDYAFRAARRELGIAPDKARAVMIRNEDWKYVLYESFRPQLFDLQADPNELHDIGDDPKYQEVRARLHEHLFEWARNQKMRVTISDAQVEARTDTHKERGFLFGVW